MHTIVQAMLRLVPSLEGAYTALVHEWQPDSPPLLSALSDLGQELARDQSVSVDVLRDIMDQTEGLLVYGDEYEKTAVSTGFLEALISSAEAESPTRAGRRYLDLMGPESRRYVTEWSRRLGIRTYDDYCTYDP